MSFELLSTAFAAGADIPARFTCEGANLSPPLAWSGAPEGTKGFVLFCDDPDAPRCTFRHWEVWGIPATATGLPEGAGGLSQAVNDFGKPAWGGPCPPPGDRPHRYLFRLCALSAPIAAAHGAVRCAELADLAAPLTLATAEFMGRFRR